MQSHGNRKKICFVVTKGVWGGAQKYVYTLATRLPKDQFDVVVIAGSGGILQEKLKEKNIKTYTLDSMKRDISLISEIKSFFALFKIIKKERPDVLHLNSAKASGLGAVVGRLLGIRNIISTAHGWAFNEDRGLFSKVMIVYFSWITVFLCHKTIVINDLEREQTEAMPFAYSHHIHLIRNGVEEIYLKDRNSAQKELLSRIKANVSRDAIWIGTIAELHKNKGLEYALEAVSKLTTPFVFFIIGEGEDRANLERLIQLKHLRNKVFLLGFMKKASEYLKAFDIFTLTSIKEGLPYTILEAGQAGLPVVASYIGGIPDIIEHGVSGILVNKGNSEEIEIAIKHLIENVDDRKTFGDNLKHKVETDFSLERMLEETIDLYK